MPESYRDPEDARAPGSTTSFTLVVEGEQFDVRVTVDAETGYTDTGYTWLSGPHPGYGFGVGGRRDPSLEDHRERIREFLATVDPATGYLQEE